QVPAAGDHRALKGFDSTAQGNVLGSIDIDRPRSLALSEAAQSKYGCLGLTMRTARVALVSVGRRTPCGRRLRGSRAPRHFRGAAAMQPVDVGRPLHGR